jgi:poly(3-hydroxyalkanoate) synthetase
VMFILFDILKHKDFNENEQYLNDIRLLPFMLHKEIREKTNIHKHIHNKTRQKYS